MSAVGRRAIRIAVFLAACAVPARAATLPSDTTAFVDVAVIEIESGIVREGMSVLVIGDRIADVGPMTSMSIPANARWIDGHGRFLMPGLADLHVHLFESRDLILYLANGITTIRNLGGYGAADSILTIRSKIDGGERAGPTIVTSGNWLDGDPPFRDINTVVATPDAARREVLRQAAAGYDFIKVYETLAPGVYAAILDAASGAGIPVTGHVPTAVGLQAVLGGDQVTIDHVAQLLPFGPAVSSADVRRIAERVADSSVAIVTTLVMLERALSLRGGDARVEALLARPEARYLSPETRAFWRRNPFAALPSTGDARLRLAGQLVAALHEADVPLLLGTDAGLWGNPPGFSVHDELGHLVDSGLTPYQALRCATIDAAAFLAEHVPGAGDFGRIIRGHRADLVLLEADPLVDVGNARRIAGVMTRGRWFDREELDRRLEALDDDAL